MGRGYLVNAAAWSCALALGCTGAGDHGGKHGGEPAQFASRVVAAGLYAPLDMAWGPDGHLWLTERVGRRITRVRPSDGARTTLITIAEAHQSAGQDGVLGMALHPGLLSGKGNDHVYVAFTYDADPGSPLDLRTKIQRYTYDAASQTLARPVDLISGLPASNDHNAGRLVFGPDGRLYYTLGDQGNNQLENFCRPIRAQELPSAAEVRARDWTRYVGKTLRMELDGSIPSDNPVLAGVRSHIYTYGHRNPQGLAFGPDDALYSVEHGPKSDDELNVLVAGKNYGWPHVAGYQDDQVYVYANWSASSPTPCEALEFSNYVIPESVPRQEEHAWSHPDFTPPIATFFTVPNGYDFQDPACAEGPDLLCWPTIAPASVAIYAAPDGGVPGWTRSALLTSLKGGAVYRVRLSADGRAVVGDVVTHFKTTNRYRDITIAPDNRTFYVITDSEGPVEGPSRGVATKLENPGSILEFKYTGPG